MQQKFDVSGKSVVTVNPGAFLNFYFTSGTGSMKITKNLSYIFGPGEWGFSIKKDNPDKDVDYSLSKHTIQFSKNGISYKWKEDDVYVVNHSSTDDFQIKVITTNKCETKTIKIEGMITAVIFITTHDLWCWLDYWGSWSPGFFRDVD